MKRFTRGLFLVFLLAAGLAGTADAAKKRYHVSDYDVEIAVQENGDLRVIETIEYAFTRGTFTYAYRKIPVRGFDDIEFVSLRSPDGLVFLESAVVTERWKKNLRVRWTYPETAKSRTFRLEYIAYGVLRSHKGKNVLDWAAVGDEWSVPMGDVDVRVILPWAFESGVEANQGATARLEEGMTVIDFHRDSLDDEEGYRVTVEFPQRLTIAPREGSGLAETTVTIVASGVLVLILLMVFFWKRVGRVEARGVPSAVATYPDAGLSIAEAAGLVHYGTMGRAAVTSLVFDLARRGILRIEARAKKGAFGTRSFDVSARMIDRSGDLPAWDERVFQELEKEGNLKKFSRRTSVISKTLKDITGRLREIGLISKERESLRRKWLIGSLILAIVSVVFMVFVVLNVWKDLLAPAILVFAGGWGLAITSALIETRSPRGMMLAGAFRSYGRWQRKRVEDLIQADPSEAAGRFTENLPELVLDKKVDRQWIKKLQKDVKDKPIEFRLPDWMNLRDASGNPLDAAVAAVECFTAFTESVAVVGAYAGGAIAGGAGGAGGGGGGGGGAG